MYKLDDNVRFKVGDMVKLKEDVRTFNSKTPLIKSGMQGAIKGVLGWTGSTPMWYVRFKNNAFDLSLPIGDDEIELLSQPCFTLWDI